jgi:hypothetical protein
LRGN